MWGDNGRKRGDKTSGRRTHHPTSAHVWGDKTFSQRCFSVTLPSKGLGRQYNLAKMEKSAKVLGVQFGVVKSDAERAMVILRDAVQGKFQNLSSGRQTHHPKDAGTHVRREWETKRGDKTSGRRTHHPTQAHVWGDNGRQWETMGDNGRQWETMGQGETRPREGGHTVQHRQTRQDPHPTQAHMWGDNGRQKGQTRRRKGGRAIQHRHMCVEAMGDNGLNGKEGETRPREGGHTIQHKHTCGDRMRDNGGQWETRRQEGGCATQHRHTCGETTGDKWRQGAGKADTPTNKKETRRETLGDEGRQDQGGHLKNALRTLRAVHCLGNKTGDNVEREDERRGDKMFRKTDTPSNKGKQEGVLWETEGDKTLGKRKQEGVQLETRGDKTLGKADAPSNKGKQEGVQSETKGDKTVRKADTPSNKGKQ